MKSFKSILVRNFTGMTFIVLVIVFVLFNVLTNNFISEEANRELSRSVTNIEAIANRTMPDVIPFDAQGPTIGFMEEILLQLRQMGSLRQLMMNADGIIISEYNEVVSPNVFLLDEEIAVEIIFLANYYVGNRDSFEAGTMVRLAGENNTYYMMAIEYPIAYGSSFSVLLYTDITSARMFMRSINRTLGMLLIVSGILSVLLSFLISSRVQKAIMRLCNYAEAIGHGNFSQKAEDFDYEEFSRLARSMNNMSNMLDTYENNQKQFFQNVSHELRTPLMSIQGYSEGILADVISKEEAVKIIMAESERMERLVSQLLYVSRLDSGLDALNITSFNLKNMLYDSAWRVKILAEKDGKEIIFDFPNEETHIKSDEEKLQRVVDNILANCIRHASSIIKISFCAAESGIELIIDDDGEGFNAADLPHIFERFYKGTNGNSGLGLAICKDIIEKLGGRIKAENIKDYHPHGARFIITIKNNEG